MALKQFFLVILLGCSQFVCAQVSDAGGWFYFSLEKDLPDKFTMGVETDVRLNENLSEAKTIFAEPWVSKEWSDGFSTTLTYRVLARRGLDNSYSERDRLSIDFKYKRKIKKIGLQYRLRVQRQLGVLNKESASQSDVGLRHRLKAGVKLSKKWGAAIAGESFYSMNNSGVLEHTDIRLKSTLKYKVKKRNYASVGYLFQREYNTNNPVTEYNLVLGYTLMIK